MRLREANCNHIGISDALQATGSFFPDYTNGHGDITSKDGNQESKDFIGDLRIGKPLRLKRADGSELPIKIVDIKGELKNDYWETEEPMIGGTYKRPERTYTPKKVVHKVIEGQHFLAEQSRIKALRTQLALDSTVPLVVGAFPTRNGHTNGHEVAKPVPVQKA